MLDWSFNSVPGANGDVFVVLVQPDRKIIVAGSFIRAGDAIRWRVARLETNGTVDASFDAGR